MFRIFHPEENHTENYTNDYTATTNDETGLSLEYQRLIQ